jgi:hypothetical protein
MEHATHATQNPQTHVLFFDDGLLVDPQVFSFGNCDQGKASVTQASVLRSSSSFFVGLKCADVALHALHILWHGL